MEAVMITKKLFWEDPYLTETLAIVTSVDGDIITLNQTIVFAFSGGQQSDSGTIAGHEIIKAEKNDTEVQYTMPQNHGISVGEEVVVNIDWDKRYRLMKLHFAAELVLELVCQDYNQPEKIGANINTDKARVDFFWNGNISETFPALESKIKTMVDSDLPIVSDYIDTGSERRYWEIEGFAKVNCGGTHLRRTGEIGRLSLKRNNIGKGKERIEIYLMQE